MKRAYASRWWWLYISLSLIYANGIRRQAAAYDVETHRVLAERATDISSLAGVLELELGLKEGLRTEFLGRSVQRWIQDGARFEDEPFRRVLNHFHNPLKPWNQAGLRVGFQLGQSSVLWQQNSNQDSSSVFVPLPLKTGGGNWSWQDARRHYLNALVRPRKEDRQNEPGRDTAFADTFRALGQVTHLVQDATVPAHVRNDPHLSFRILDVPIPVNPDWYEDWAERNRDKVSKFINLEPVKPPISIFRPTGDSQVPVPIARLIDNDKFQDGDFSVLLNPDLGTAEYTNGNFLSRNRIFGSFTLPRTSSLDFDNPIVKPVGTKWRRYFSKVREGEAVEHFVAESMLFRSLRIASTAPPPSGGWMMDDRIQEDYASKLLPRAVGYSAGLLDYFFRGKLDVDLVEDPDNPSIVQLRGTNASPEKLDGGKLTIYADDADGNRNQATSDLTIVAEPGQGVESAFFVAPENTERYVAVYKGKLGEERPEGTFPGAVIGKVLGGVRVEQVFTDFSRWYLRTPQNIYPLPILYPQVAELRWGEKDNTLVGKSSPYSAAADQFFVYEMQRPEGSTAVSMRTELDGSEVVDVKLVQQIPFPFQRNLGVNVKLTNTIHYKQHLPWAILTTMFTWVPDNPSNPNQGHYEEAVLLEGQITLAAEDTRNHALNFPVILSPETTIDHSRDEPRVPYTWYMDDFAVTRNGKVLAKILVFPNGPVDYAYFLPVYQMQVPPGSHGSVMPQAVQVRFTGESIDYPFMRAPLLTTWLDVQSGQVVSSTAPDNLTMDRRVLLEVVGEYYPAAVVFERHRFVGGLRDGEYKYVSQFAADTFRKCPDGQPVGFLGAAAHQRIEEVNLSQYHPELAELLPASDTRLSEQNREIIIQCSLPRFKVNFVVGTPVASGIGQVVQPRQSSDGRLAVLMEVNEPFVFGDTPEGKVIMWNPSKKTVEVRHQFPKGFNFIQGATSKVALVGSSFDFSDFNHTLVSLEGNTPPRFYPEGLPNESYSAPFTVLEPEFLYNTGDTKFYSKQGTMPRRTPLPAKLATISGITFNSDFHTISLK